MLMGFMTLFSTVIAPILQTVQQSPGTVRLLSRIFLHMVFGVESNSAYDILYTEVVVLAHYHRPFTYEFCMVASLIPKNTAMQYYYTN